MSIFNLLNGNNDESVTLVKSHGFFQFYRFIVYFYTTNENIIKEEKFCQAKATLMIAFSNKKQPWKSQNAENTYIDRVPYFH